MSWLLRTVYRLAYHLGIIHLFYWLNRKKVIVITYHNIIPDHLFDRSPHLGVSHSASVFRAQLQVIGRRFRPSKWPASPGACVITFDDGFKNQWHIAGSILKEFDFPAIYFIPFAPLEDGRCLKVDEILKWISYAPPAAYEICGESILLTQDARAGAFAQIYDHLIRHPESWSIICSELDRAAKFDDLTISRDLDFLRFTPLDPSEIGEVRAAGHQVGCHSWEHLPLGSLPAAHLKREFDLCKSKRDLYTNSLFYSYPFGSSIEEVSTTVALRCAESGFQWAFLNTYSISGLVCEPQFAVPRISLPNTADRYALEAKLSGFERALKRLRGNAA